MTCKVQPERQLFRADEKDFLVDIQRWDSRHPSCAEGGSRKSPRTKKKSKCDQPDSADGEFR